MCVFFGISVNPEIIADTFELSNDSPPQVTMASRPALDAWYGARDWALEHLPTAVGGPAEGWISRQEYEEKGGEYLSEHCASNIFIPMKIAKPAPPARPVEPSVTTVTSFGASAADPMATSASTQSSSTVAADVSMVTS